MNIEEQVLLRIKPTLEEAEIIKDIVTELFDRVKVAAKEFEIPGIEPKLVGSAARGTWISGTHDLDIFISFPEDASREELEEHGLMIAREVSKDAEYVEERYAEHPYMNMQYQGFDVDIVPCFAVDRASNIKSAVDRTPFHNEFIKENINGREDEVLLLKQFMKGTGVYGSELRTQGFSGYLTELLTLNYGSFKEVIANACDWRPGTIIDLKSHGTIKHDEPLSVIDPTDPKRNVAAALSIDRFAGFIDICRSYTEEPAMHYFFPEPEKPLDDMEIENLLNERKSSFVAIVFKAPDVVDDILYPQLDKMKSGVRALLEENEFTVLNSITWAGEDAVVLMELLSSRLPEVKKHQGPPVWVRSHAQAFKSKYESTDGVFSFYVENGYYVADIKRKFATAKDLLEGRINTCALGKQITLAVNEGFRILVDREICNIEDEDFRISMRKWNKIL
ncbi:CCA tRNA nucleotidyltransferase [Methanolobus sp. ZRKC3]|uniref:CCA tRNA nucleotidyltransferase n=1 Tax=Methanolobus sp. ZRKC3 TaxID=3125786 RepID=UPI003252A8F7